MARGFLYLVAIMDWASRKVLSWRLSNTLDTYFCVEPLQEALNGYGSPEIFNTDQGGLSSPAMPSSRFSRMQESESAWTARAGGSTTCSSSGCGEA